MIKRLAVQDANADNALKLVAGDTGCCGDTVTTCQYTATYTQANSVTLLNILDADGAAQALPLVIAGAATAATAQAAVLATLIAAGYIDDENEDLAGVVVTDLGTTLQIVITGDVVPVSITTSGGTSTFSEDCTQVNLCNYAITGYAGGTTGSAATTLRINGVNYDIGTVTPGTTTSGAVSTAVDTQLASAGVAGATTTTTTGSGGSQTYNITITGSESDNTIRLAGTQLTRSACAPDFI